jgi:hypothetical protein
MVEGEDRFSAARLSLVAACRGREARRPRAKGRARIFPMMGTSSTGG